MTILFKGTLLQATKPCSEHAYGDHIGTGVHRALLARKATKGEDAWQFTTSQALTPLSSDQVLVRTIYAGLNPFDWQSVVYGYGVGSEPRVMGRDGAGIIVGKGKAVDRFSIGDRVWFCANPALPSSGAFQEYSIHSASEVAHTPSHMSHEEAATLGSGLVTAGVILFRTLGVPLDTINKPAELQNQPWILIWGGAGATGVFLVQLSRILGYRVICAASPINHDYLRSLGAEITLDRWKNPHELVDEIRAATEDQVFTAIDNVGSETARLCYQVLEGSALWAQSHCSKPGPTKTVLVAIAGNAEFATGPDAIRHVETPRLSFSTTFFQHPTFSIPLLDLFTSLLESGTIQPMRLRHLPGGLEGIREGLRLLQDGKGVGGRKLITRVTDSQLSMGTISRPTLSDLSVS